MTGPDWSTGEVFLVGRRIDEIQIAAGTLDDKRIGIISMIGNVEGSVIEIFEIYAAASFLVNL